MMRRLRLLVLLARPAVIILLALFAAIGMAQSGHADGPVLQGLAFVAVIGFVLFSVAINDLADEEIDRVNLTGRRRRPLQSGAGTRIEMRLVAVVAAATALLAAALLGRSVLGVVAIGLGLSAAYSLRPVRLADRGSVAAFVLPACYVAVPYLIGLLAAQGAIGSADLRLLCGLYLGFIGRIVLKDFRDVRGDALFGKRTVLVRHGRRRTTLFSAIALVLGTGLLTASVGELSFGLVAAASATATVALLAALARDHGARRDETLISAIAILGRGTLVALLAQLTMTNAGWTAGSAAAVLAGLAGLVAGQVATMLRHGPHCPLTSAAIPTDGSVDGSVDVKAQTAVASDASGSSGERPRSPTMAR